jgi:hypothetical protein
MLRLSDRSKCGEGFLKGEVVVVVVAPNAEVPALFPKGELPSDTHSSGEEGMLSVDVAAGANKLLAQAYYDRVGVGRGLCLTSS